MPSTLIDAEDDVDLVTVVLPVYNHAKYVGEAIDSVRRQTLTRWKLIIIDDGSTDDSWLVLQEHVAHANDSRIVLLQQPNGGSHAALNRGLAMASTPCLAILNSDDRYAPERLERLVDIARNCDGDVFIATGASLIDQGGMKYAETHWWNVMYADMLQRWQSSQAAFGSRAAETLFWGNFTISTSNFFMTRSLWNDVGSFRKFRYVLDWEYVLRIATKRPLAFHFVPDEVLLEYRLHGQNTILTGALRNHAEAYHMLRKYQKEWAAAGRSLPVQAIDRLHYLGRFIRHEHTRKLLEQHKACWMEQVSALEEELRRAKAAEQQANQRVERRAAAVLRRSARAVRRWTSKYIPFVGMPERIIRALAIRRSADDRDVYARWLESEAGRLRLLHDGAPRIIAGLSSRPLISIVMPVHDTPPAFLQAAIASVQAQWYENWQLCICDDASGNAETRAMLEHLSAQDHKIKIIRRTQTGHIVRASNDALSLALGDFVVFMDHDDVLAPQALLRLAQEIDAAPEVDCIYSDEDKLDTAGARCLPLFKPQWSPALLWAQNYIGHLTCVRRSRLLGLGGVRLGSEGSQDHDLMLRLAEDGASFRHVPEVLYHWRMHSGSTASNAQSKPYAHEAGKRAVARHLARRYGARFDRVEDGDDLFVYSPRFHVPEKTLASIIVPTRDKPELLHACIKSIQQHPSALAYEILVLDNNSREPQTKTLLTRITQQDARIRVIDAPIAFNWSRLNNIGRTHARGNVLVFLNNDTEVISPDWLLRLAEYALLPDVATVGPLLLYPDQTIQHAGVVVGMGGWADHVFKGERPRHYPTPFVSSVVQRNVLANTGACLALATARFDALGGFDEAFEVCGSDVELGIRAHRQGLLNVYLPSVRLTHFESKTRSSVVPAGDFEQSASKYAPYRLGGDPFYNPNLDLTVTAARPRVAGPYPGG